MIDNDFTDDEIDALLEGRSTADGSDEIVRFIDQLRHEATATPPVVARAALAEYTEGTRAADIVPISRGARVRRGAAAIAATTAGKLVLGTAVAAASLGGAHAADLIGVPGLPTGARPVIVEDETPPTADAEDPNHGSDVSDFVHSTDLEGCEKGQAVSDIASANAADNRNDPERDHDPCADRPADSGKPDDTGKPDNPGKPDDTGKPDNPGKPD